VTAASVRRIVADVEHFRRRVLQDALAEATAMNWERRACAFEAALPRQGDFTGRATPDEVYARAMRVSAVAKACRHRATLGLGADDVELLDDVLAGVA